MKKYHVNSEGNVLECQATVKTCPMGHHASTKAEATELYQQSMKQQQFRPITKKTNKTVATINSFSDKLTKNSNKKEIAEKYIQFSKAINDESIQNMIHTNSFHQYELNNEQYETFRNLTKDPEFLHHYNQQLEEQLSTIMDNKEQFDNVTDVKMSSDGKELTITLDSIPHKLTIQTSSDSTIHISVDRKTMFTTQLSRGKNDPNETAKQRIMEALTNIENFKQILPDIDRPTSELLDEKGKQKYTQIQLLKKMEQITYNARNLKEKDNIPLDTPYEQFAIQRKLKNQVTSPDYQQATGYRNFIDDIAEANGGHKNPYFSDSTHKFSVTTHKIDQFLAVKEREEYKSSMKPVVNMERNASTQQLGFRYIGDNKNTEIPESKNYDYRSYSNEINQFLAGDKNILMQTGATSRIIAARDGEWEKRYTEKEIFNMANSFLRGEHNNPNARNEKMGNLQYEDVHGVMEWSKQCLNDETDTRKEYRNLYRGGVTKKENLDAIQVGTVIQSETPISTSAEKEIAKSFADGKGHVGVRIGEGETGYRMNIISKRGKDMRPHAIYVYENEYLLPMGIQLTCVEKTMVDGVPTFTMVETS